MAAQEPPKELVCPQCFELNPAGSPFCQDCGAPLSNAPAAEGSDQAVYKDLAQANLLRMRGNHKQAGEACLAILKRYPNNATAHALLGDIYAESNDLEQAIQWYELALDLHDDDNVRTKLNATRERKENAERQASVTELGLPEKPPKTGLFAGILIAAIVVVGAGAFFAGRQMSGSELPKPKPTLSSGVSLSPDENGVQENTGQAPTGVILAPQDQEMTETLKGRSLLGQNILYVISHPQGPGVTVTTLHPPEASMTQAAAQAALDALASFPSCIWVTVRVIAENQIALVANVERTTLQRIEMPAEGQLVSEESAAAILQNIWPVPADSTAPPSTTSGSQGEVETGGEAATPPTTEDLGGE